MKIAMIGHKRIPSREGGVEIVVEKLAVRMVEMGHEVDVYNRWEIFDGEAPERRSEFQGVHVYNIPTFKSSTLNAFVYSFIATVKAVFKHYDLIHFHAEGPSAMLFLPKLFGIKTVATIHGLDWQRAKWGGFATRYLLLGERIAAKYADILIVLSRGMQRYFKDIYDRDTYYVPNGVELQEYVGPKLITEKYGLKKNSYILFLARIVPEKGLHYLIEAYKEIKTDKRLVIAGKINLKNEYDRKICEMASEDERIIMTDFVQGRMLGELFSNCFLYVLPSDVEGMALSLLEALSYGVRCLVSDIEESVEITGEYAENFEKGNTAILREKIKKILDLGEVYKNSYQQIDFVTRQYSWDTVAQDTLKLYKQLVSDEEKA